VREELSVRVSQVSILAAISTNRIHLHWVELRQALGSEQALVEAYGGQQHLCINRITSVARIDDRRIKWLRRVDPDCAATQGTHVRHRQSAVVGIDDLVARAGLMVLSTTVSGYLRRPKGYTQGYTNRVCEGTNEQLQLSSIAKQDGCIGAGREILGGRLRRCSVRNSCRAVDDEGKGRESDTIKSG